MPLNLQPNDGSEFVTYIKYNSKAGRWYAKNKDGTEFEITNPRLAFDMANIKTGWIMFIEGMGPMSAWDNGPEMAAKPEGRYKRGFHLMVCGGDNLQGIGPLGVREFSSTANVVITAILAMHAQYEDQMNAHPGQVPFFQCTGVTPKTGMHGTNYEPGFRLTGWVDRNRVPFDEHLKAQTTNGGDPFPGVTRGMPDDPNAPLPPAATAPQGGGGFNQASDDLADEIPW